MGRLAPAAQLIAVRARALHQAARKRMHKERELDGIDPSLIIDGGARPRRAAAKPVDYR